MTSENGQKIENNSPEEEEVPQEEVPQEEVPQEEVPQEEVPQDSNIIEDNSEQSYEKTVDNQSGEGLETESARDEDMGYASETDNLEKMILATGIRVGEDQIHGSVHSTSKSRGIVYT
jgi:hypothetical protein